MIIIAGAGHPISKKFITLKIQHCFHCNNDTYWILEKTRYYISLFFLPVIPFKTEYLYYCPICGNSEKLGKEEFERKVKYEAKPYQS